MYGVIWSIAGEGLPRRVRQTDLETATCLFERIFPSEKGEATPFDVFMYGQALARAQDTGDYLREQERSFWNRLGLTRNQLRRFPGRLRQDADAILRVYRVGFTMRRPEISSIIRSTSEALRQIADAVQADATERTDFSAWNGRGALLAGFLDQVRSRSTTYHYPEVAVLCNMNPSALKKWHSRHLLRGTKDGHKP